MYYLYKNEKNIAENCNKIIEGFDKSKREKGKKKVELFHLLTFLDLCEKKYNEVECYDPGDFILKIHNKTIMVEVLTVFGQKDANIKLKELMKNIFNFNTNDELPAICETNNLKKEVLISKLKEKQRKLYSIDRPIDEKVLLIVTAEYENCPAMGNWLVRFVEEGELEMSGIFDKISVLNYNANSKEGGPSIIKDFKKELFEYKNIFDEKE